MESFSNVLKQVNLMLPLEVVKVTFIGEQLIIETKKIRIVCATAWWRILGDSSIKLGCCDDDADKITELKGESIAKIIPQSPYRKSDITILFSNNLMLEMFSTNSLEPWDISINGGEPYFSDPSDKEWAQ